MPSGGRSRHVACRRSRVRANASRCGVHCSHSCRAQSVAHSETDSGPAQSVAPFHTQPWRRAAVACSGRAAAAAAAARRRAQEERQ
eukprot:8327152-Lingulodinium_polyedra.AAC.1